MSNNKQSSLDYYITKLTEILGPYIQQISRDDNERIARLEKQAKAMHKEEHGQTWDKSMENFEARGRNEMRAWVDFDEYYNETFGE